MFPGDGVEKATVKGTIKRHAQFAVIVVFEGDEAEGLHAGALKLAGRLQHFGHAANGAGAGMERDFYKIAGGEFMRQLQQAAVDGNRLYLRARLVSPVSYDGGWD